MKLENIKIEKIYEGIQKVFANSESLIKDAELLYMNERWSRSYALFQLALEEYAKITTLIDLWISRLSGLNPNYKKLNKAFTDHISKGEESLMAEKWYLNSHKEEYPILNLLLRILEKYNVEEANELKNNSLYVSIGDNEFISPDEIIDKKKVDDIYFTALSRKQVYNKFRISPGDILQVSENVKLELKNLFNSIADDKGSIIN